MVNYLSGVFTFFDWLDGDATACETTRVVSNVVNCTSIFDETSRVVLSGDMVQFVEAVLDMLSKPQSERQTMDREALAKVKQLNGMGSVAKDYLDLYVKHVHLAKVGR